MQPKMFIATKAVIRHNEKILLLRESGKYEDGTNSGRYDFPGGRLNPGEHFSDALRREVSEETGLEVTIGNPFFVSEWRPVVKGEAWQIIGIFFLCDAVSSKVILSGDHEAYEWIKPEEYEKFNIIENLEPVFKAYLESK